MSLLSPVRSARLAALAAVASLRFRFLMLPSSHFAEFQEATALPPGSPRSNIRHAAREVMPRQKRGCCGFSKAKTGTSSKPAGKFAQL
jgi:hypothetical protein